MDAGLDANESSHLEIPGPAGTLEALLRAPASPKGAALIAHSHPGRGGTGFSFGSLCVRAAERVSPELLLLIGVPIDGEEAAGVVPGATRVVWVQGANDEFSTKERAREIAAARGWRFHAVPGADHFFSGRLAEFESVAGDALAEWLGT